METPNSWTHRTRRGKKKKIEDTVRGETVIEVHHPDEATPMVYRPSCSLMPARLLGAPLDDFHIKPTIKTEAVETDKSSSSSPSNIERPSEKHENNLTEEIPAEESSSMPQPSYKRIKEEPMVADDEFPSSSGHLTLHYSKSAPDVCDLTTSIEESTFVPEPTNKIIKEEPMDADNVPSSSSVHPTLHYSKSVANVCDLNRGAEESSMPRPTNKRIKEEPMVADDEPPSSSGQLTLHYSKSVPDVCDLTTSVKESSSVPEPINKNIKKEPMDADDVPPSPYVHPNLHYSKSVADVCDLTTPVEESSFMSEPINKIIKEEPMDADNVPSSSSVHPTLHYSKYVANVCDLNRGAEESSMPRPTNKRIKEEPMVADDEPPSSSGQLTLHYSKSVADVCDLTTSVEESSSVPEPINKSIKEEPMDVDDVKCNSYISSSDLRLPRSRSSSTDTVVAEEYLQRPSTEKYLLHDQSFTLNKIESLKGEIANQFTVSPICNPFANMSISEPEASVVHLCTRNKPFKTHLLKFIHANFEINRTEVEECLNTINHACPQTRSFNRFFDDIPSQRQLNDLAAETVQSPIVSSIETSVSTDELKRIIELTSSSGRQSLSNLQLLSQNDSNYGNTVSGTDNTPSSSVINSMTSISNQSDVDKGQSLTSHECLTSKVLVKTEPLDNYEVSSFASISSNCPDAPTSSKRPASEKSTDVYTVAKKIKTEPVSPDHSVVSARDEDAKETSSRDPLPQNVGSRKAISFVENVPQSTINNNVISIASQPDIVEDQSVMSEQFPSQNIQIKREPLDDYEICSSVIQMSKSSKRSTNKITSDMHPMKKNIETEAVSSEGDTEVTKHSTSKIARDRPLTNDNFSIVGNAASGTKNIVQNSGKIGYFSSINSNGISQSSEVEPKISTYLRSVPQKGISVGNKISDAKNIIQNNNKLSSLPSRLPTVIGSGMPNTSGASNRSTYDKTDRLNSSSRSTSNNEISRERNDLSVDKHFLGTYEGNSFFRARDPRLQKSNILDSPSQVSFPISSVVQPTVLPAGNQQNQTFTFVSSSQNRHKDYITEGRIGSKELLPRKLRQESLTIGSKPIERRLPPKNILVKHTLSDILPMHPRNSEVPAILNMSPKVTNYSGVENKNTLQNCSIIRSESVGFLKPSTRGAHYTSDAMNVSPYDRADSFNNSSQSNSIKETTQKKKKIISVKDYFARNLHLREK